MKSAVMDPVVSGNGDADVFERARRAGFAGVEVVLRRDDLRSPGRERLGSLRDAKKQSSLQIPSLVLGEHSEGGIADADSSVAAAAARDVEDALAWAAELGADVVLVPFFLRGELVSESDVDRAASAFRALCRAAVERGVTLCYEGTLPADRVRSLAARVDSSGFACYFDLANPVARGLDTATELRALARLVRRVHLKDTRVTPGDCAPGLGRVDFAETARALADIGYDGWLVFETPPGPWEVVRRDVAFARTVFPQLEADRTWPRFGAFSYDFGAGEWERLGETFGDLGLEVVQLGSELLEECLADPDVAERGRTTLGAHGVAIAGLAGYRNLIAPDAATRRANVGAIERCLELAPLLGTSIVATETGTRAPHGDWTDSPDNWSQAAWDLLDDAIRTLLPVAERCGTVLALEATVKNVLRTAGQLLGILERFPSRHLQVVCDPYNYLSSHLLPAQERTTRDFLDRFEHRFAVAHLKDVDARGAEVATPEFGMGVFEQRQYLDFLRTRRPDLPIVIEHLPLEHIPEVIERCRETLAAPLSSESPPA